MNDNGLVHGLVLDGKGGARPITLEQVADWSPDQGLLWLHFDYTNEQAQQWILENGELDHAAAEYILAEETRPRSLVVNDSMLVALRGVNLNPGSDPEDMVSIRVWMDKHRILSTRLRTLVSVNEIVEALQQGRGPATAGEFIAELAEHLAFRIEATITDIEEKMDLIDEQNITEGVQVNRRELADLRRDAILLRRYLAPQRDVMLRLGMERTDLFDNDDRMHMRETADQLIRLVEALDTIRDRAAVTYEELSSRHAEEMNKRMYVLSVVAAIFLPLGFLTGLFGINVGGIPGAGDSMAFFIFVGIMVVVVIAQILLFKWRKWL